MSQSKPKRRLYINPYKIILRRKIIDGFAAFSDGDYQPLLNLYADDAWQKFAGQHALGGERRGKERIAQWFERFVRLLPSKFTIHDVYVVGGPWNTVATVQFEDRVQPSSGRAYTNHGVMIARVKWGKADKVYIYVDTQKISTALDDLAKDGVAEASASPIE